MATVNPFDIPAPEDAQQSVLTAGSTQNMSGALPLAQTPTQQYNPTPSLAPQTYTAQTTQVNVPTETMQGQLSSILSKNSPLMEQARTSATQQMAQRGLINSSMAAGAGTAAMIERALPIAQQDAQTYANRTLVNQDAVNQQNQFNVGQTNDIYKFGQGIAAQYGLQTAQQANDLAKMAVQQGYNLNNMGVAQQYDLAKMGTAQQYDLAKMEAAQRDDLIKMAAQQGYNLQNMGVAQQNELARMDVNQRYDLIKLATQQGYNLESMSAAQLNELARMQLAQRFNLQTLDAQAQAELDKMSVGQQYNLLNMATQQGYNLQTLNAQQVNELQRMATQQQYSMQQLSSQQYFQERIAALEQSGLDFRQARDLASREMLFKLEQAGITNRFDQELALKAEQFNVEQYNLERRQIIDNQAQMERLGLQINANNQNIPTSFAANISNTTMAGVSSIMADPNMTAASKQAAINNLINYANAQIAWAEKFYATAIPRLGTTTVT